MQNFLSSKRRKEGYGSSNVPAVVGMGIVLVIGYMMRKYWPSIKSMWAAKQIAPAAPMVAATAPLSVVPPSAPVFQPSQMALPSAL